MMDAGAAGIASTGTSGETETPDQPGPQVQNAVPGAETCAPPRAIRRKILGHHEAVFVQRARSAVSVCVPARTLRIAAAERTSSRRASGPSLPRDARPASPLARTRRRANAPRGTGTARPGLEPGYLSDDARRGFADQWAQVWETEGPSYPPWDRMRCLRSVTVCWRGRLNSRCRTDGHHHGMERHRGCRQKDLLARRKPGSARIPAWKGGL